MPHADLPTQLLLAEQFITDLLRKLCEDPAFKIDAYKLDPAEQEGAMGYRLTAIVSGRGTSTFFTKEDLIEDYGTDVWKEHIRNRIIGFLSVIQNGR